MLEDLHRVVRRRRANAALGWLLVAALLVTAAAEAVDGDPLWAGFAVAVAVIAAVPAVATRSVVTMLPWEVVAVAALPVAIRALVAGQRIAGTTLTGRVTTYVAVAAVALLLAVEIDLFTPVRMNARFAVLLVTVTTVAAAGAWALVNWGLDRLAGTAFMLDGRPEAVIERALMLDFVAATVAGVGAGALFELYFRRRRGRAGADPAADGGEP